MNTLDQLAETIHRRAVTGDSNSWTAKLISGGPERCAKKFGEEAVEAALAGASGKRGELVRESADLLYHLLVLLEVNDVSLKEVYAELERRQGTSGLEEKRQRDISHPGT
ncbi:MAG: phosphoribosyl-ATP diphosphatase [Rhodobacteraceae bacterium]|nr:phosphoribosyl-ATP diphosphatase [Paracoccaceae bacterium]